MDHGHAHDRPGDRAARAGGAAIDADLAQESPGKTTLMHRALDGGGVSSGAEQAVERASSSSGQPLPGDLRRQFESSLRTDLGAVRVHTGSDSATAARGVGAKAFALGNDIHFNAGQYNPGSETGRHLIAHEVAHTVQQGGAPRGMQHKLEVSSPGDSLEHEADRAASAMVRGAPAQVSVSPSSAFGVARKIHRYVDEDGKYIEGTGDANKEVWGPKGPNPSSGITGSSPREPLNWGALAVPTGSGVVDGKWSAAPHYALPEKPALLSKWEGPAYLQQRQRVYDIHMKGVNKFSADWGQLQASWNGSADLITAYKEAADKAQELGVTGPATPEHAEGVVKQPLEAKPGASKDLGSTVLSGKPTGNSSKLSVGDVYDGTSVKPGLASKVKRDAGLDDAVNKLMQDAQIALDDAVGEAAKATIDYKNQVLEITKKIAALKIAEQQGEADKATQDKDRLEREKAKVIGGIQAVSALFGAGEKFIAGKSGAEPATTGKAAADAGFVGAISTVVQYFVSQSFDADLKVVQERLNGITNLINSFKIESAGAEVEQAKNELIKKQIDIKQKARAVAVAEQKRRDALDKVAKMAREKAAKGGATKEQQDKLETAIRSKPAVELVVSRIQAILDRLQVPAYSEDSGRGASFCSSIGDFVIHIVNILNTVPTYQKLLEEWNARLKSVDGLIKSLHT